MSEPTDCAVCEGQGGYHYQDCHVTCDNAIEQAETDNKQLKARIERLETENQKLTAENAKWGLAYTNDIGHRLQIDDLERHLRRITELECPMHYACAQSNGMTECCTCIARRALRRQ